uniref:Uncharacterized protein n=1 Tax=Branchiostoma floridae TaxID=7739 RepID=C3ZL60_BRAFL|eukprot:XP_002590731.1 hypothetical protein BRAFLDRAFT_89537 [Branchiostoma floridae]
MDLGDLIINAERQEEEEAGEQEEQERHPPNGHVLQHDHRRPLVDGNGPADLIHADPEEEEEAGQERHLANGHLQLQHDQRDAEDIHAGLEAEGGYQNGDPPAVPVEGGYQNGDPPAVPAEGGYQNGDPPAVPGEGEEDGEQQEPVNEEEVKRKEEQRKCKRLYISIWGVSLGFMLVYACHHGVLNMEKILNEAKGRGHDTTSMLLGFGAASCFFAVIPVKWIGAKWVSFLGLGFITIFTALYYMPDSQYTQSVAGALAGLATGPVWASQGRLMAPVWENLAFSLQFVFRNDTMDVYSLREQIGNLTCGRRNERYDLVCSWGERRQECLVPFIDSALVTFCIVSILLFFGVVGMTTSLLMTRKLTRSTEDSRNQMKVQRYFWLIVTKIPRMWGEWRLRMLIPLIIFTGMQQAFVFIDFADSYAFCGTGSMWSGFIMASYGLCSGLAALVIGYVLPRVGRLCIVAVGAVLNLVFLTTLLLWSPQTLPAAAAFLTTLLLWTPKPYLKAAYGAPRLFLYDLAVLPAAFLTTLLLWTPKPYLLQKDLSHLGAPFVVPQNIGAFFAVVAGFGLCDAIWQVFLNSLLGIMFYHKRSEVAFSNFRLFSILGMSLAFWYRDGFSVLVKICLLIVTFIISLGLYGWFEWRYRRVQHPQNPLLNEDDAEDDVCTAVCNIPRTQIDEDDAEDDNVCLFRYRRVQHPQNPQLDEDDAEDEEDDGEDQEDDLRNPGAPWHPDPNINFDNLQREGGAEAEHPGVDDLDEDDLDEDDLENDPIVGRGVIIEEDEEELLNRGHGGRGYRLFGGRGRDDDIEV